MSTAGPVEMPVAGVARRPGKGWRRLRARFPKTITGLMAAGCVLAAAPLLGGLIYANVVLDRLTRQTESVLDHGLAMTQLGMQLRDDLINLERSTRQYALLGDARLEAITERRWQDTERTVRRLGVGSPASPSTPLALDISARFNQASKAWHERNADSMIEAINGIHALAGRVDGLIANAHQQSDTEIQRLHAGTVRARRQLLICALTLIPLGGLLAWGFSVAVTRPVKQMFRAIAAIGHGRFEAVPIIEFPREMRRLGQQIEWLRGRLAQLEADKDRFLRQVSHELKTPLASLREGTELLSEGALGPLSARQTEVADILTESAFELEGLIDNLLSYAEWRSGRQEWHKQWFDAQTLIEEVLSVHRLRLAKRELRTELDAGEQRLFGLRTQLRVALDNLITNAIKHSPTGAAIEIGVTTDAETFELKVRDFGRGVPQADKESIFEPFVRGSEVEERGIRGSGIGLSTVREIVLAHDGRVWVEDAQPGACFRLCWPRPDD